tara:strand:- start:596 stop:709 length:114 start_codon:yes stop_codon:yes gene_type:complete
MICFRVLVVRQGEAAVEERYNPEGEPLMVPVVEGDVY